MAKETVTVKAAQDQPAAMEYDAAEIAKNARSLFGYSPDLATAALRVANLKRCSLDKARNTIKSFAERKVK